MGLIDYFRDLVRISLSRNLRSIENEVMYQINIATQKIVHRIVREMVSVFLLLFAVAFLAFAFVFLFIEYFALTKTISFLIVGVIILFFALIIRMRK